MSYTVVQVRTHLTALEQQINQAKQKGTYDAEQQHWDGEVQKILAHDCAVAEHNVDTSNQLIQVQRQQAKQSVDLVEKTLQKKPLTNADLKFVEELPASVQQCLTRISTDLKELMTANAEYRGDWPGDARSLLSPQGQAIVGPYQANRNKQIDGQAATTALKKRVEEYVQRAPEYVKQAKQSVEGNAGGAAFVSDVDGIKKKMEDGRGLVKDLHFKKKVAIQNIKDIEKTKPWSADQKKIAKSALAEIVANAKNARGQLKTLGVLYEGLKNRGKNAGVGYKDMAAKAVAEAKKPLDEAEAASKAFDADEAKCKKICQDHGVSV